MSPTLLTLQIQSEPDVVLTRQRTKQLTALLGFDLQEQTRIATAVSEIARNSFQYAGGGKVEFRVEGQAPPQLLIIIRDTGPGIANLQQVLSGQYTSSTGMGMGITGSRRLMEQFQIESIVGQGTTVVMGKSLPRGAAPLTPQRLQEITNDLIQHSPDNSYAAIQQQNQELLQTLAALRQREEQLNHLNRELEDTNRGVVALYAELDQRADALRRADELKTRFLSNMSHEFRTPLNSIISLSRLLLDRSDGELSLEQEKQVNFIRKAASDLSELVNDLLDLAKVEAGKTIVQPSHFEISSLFATLRGMLRPLLSHNSSVTLVFEEPVDVPTLYTDEGKVAQILRNFISNALKFTERGEIRVSARHADGQVILAVADTGIGIAEPDQPRIFEDFVQVESYLHKKSQGTGLGLPLSRKLTELLGGTVTLTSSLGQGSTFAITLPITYAERESEVPKSTPSWYLDPQRSPILAVEDHADVVLVYEKHLEESPYQLIAVPTLEEAYQALEQFQPAALILDVMLERQNTWSLLAQVKDDPRTKSVPILVTSVMDDSQQATALGAEGFLIKPVDRLTLLKKLNTLLNRVHAQTLLLIDDDLVARYLLKHHLTGLPIQTLETGDGYEGIQLAITEQPQCIILDLNMPKISGVEVLHQLKENPATSSIPVIIHTSKLLDVTEWSWLNQRCAAILAKDPPSQEMAIANLLAALTQAGLSLSAQGRRV